jgi:hypothetical protein
MYADTTLSFSNSLFPSFRQKEECYFDFVIFNFNNLFSTKISKSMKKMNLLLVAIAVTTFCNVSHAQVWTPNVNTTDNISRTGNVSIGTTSTAVSGGPKFQVQAMTSSPFGIPTGTSASISLDRSDGNRSAVSLCDYGGTWGGRLIVGISGNTSTGLSEVFSVFDGGSTMIGTSSSTGTMLNVKGGNVIIGSVSTPAGYKLFVETGILTEKLKVAVKTTGNWSDYVFDKDYKLLSLGEVESYIKKNKHLPGVPSAEDVVKNGIDMATMDAKLLEKIEELTLYMIEMKKENEAIRKEMDILKNK